MSQICLGHITGCCKDCAVDEKNQDCPHYHPVGFVIYEVKPIATEDKVVAVTTTQDRK